MDKKII